MRQRLGRMGELADKAWYLIRNIVIICVDMCNNVQESLKMFENVHNEIRRLS